MIAAGMRPGFEHPHRELGPRPVHRQRDQAAGQPAADNGNVAVAPGHAAALADGSSRATAGQAV